VLRRLTVHDDFLGSLPPGDDDDDPSWQGVPPEHRPALAELLLHCLAVEVCRLESLGERLCVPACDDPRVAATVAEVRRKAVEHVAGGGTLAELRSRLKGLRKATWRWSRPLPLGPGDKPAEGYVREGGVPDEAPEAADWVVARLFPDEG
jgi:hypothetical protein